MYCKEFGTFVEKDIVINELIPIFKQLAADEQVLI